jgi:hypothetical protein
MGWDERDGKWQGLVTRAEWAVQVWTESAGMCSTTGTTCKAALLVVALVGGFLAAPRMWSLLG